MQRNIARNLLFGLTAFVLIGASLLVMHIGMEVHADPNTPMTLSQQVVPLVRQSHLLRAADASQPLNLSVSLQLRNRNELDSLLNTLYDPMSSQYHQYLTPEQFSQLFAPTSNEVQQVTAYLQSHGLTVISVASNNLLIDATGTVAQAQQAFNTQINMYQLGMHTFYANANAPSVPSAISPLVASINGLDNSSQPQPLYQRMSREHAQLLVQQHIGQIKHTKQFATPNGYGPNDLAGAYGAATLHSMGMLGDNQTVALYELDGYLPNDIAQYAKMYNLGNPNLSNVLVDGFPGTAGQNAVEVELDIELMAAMAPHANQLVYEGPNTPQGMNDTYNKIVTDNRAQIVSISWGLCETSSSPGELQTLDNIFKQGAAQGMSFFAAAGDSGAYDCADTNLAVDSPASDPYVTSVGGTTLQVNNGTYGSETVWSNPHSISHGPEGAGGGGGLSKTFKQPSWQVGPGVKNSYSNGYRQVPDVTANADTSTGYAMYCTVTNSGCNANGWLVIGGTSGAAPVWSGSVALINQYLQANGQKRIGFANPTLYMLFNAQQGFPAFHDITTGNNLYYPATAGYDLASGMGSPDVYNIARDLLNISLGITPTPTPTNTPTPSPSPTPPPVPSPTLTPTDTPSPTPSPPPSPSQSLIQNGDFEIGQTPWQESSAKGYELIEAAKPYTGQYSVYLCGYMGCDDRIWQTFTVPANYSTITVSYWWYSDTSKPSKLCLDTFSSQLQTSGGANIQMLQFACNTNVSNAWIPVTVDVSTALAPYTGQTVTLSFHSTTMNGRYQTSDFYVDDVTIIAQ
ncbi:MAG TPA: S53 family peptidase [Ktedonobacteraceae bacterium]|nr:S53 family peptidase [Ktedonobacteraceae bacterium]